MQLHHLHQLADVFAGNSAPPKDTLGEEGIPFVRAGSLEFLIRGKGKNCEKIRSEVAEKCKLRLFKKDSILFAKSGMSAKMGRVYRLDEDAYVVSHLAIIQPKKDMVIPGYLEYYFIFNPPFHLIRDDAYPSITLESIRQIELNIPDLNTQRQIVAALDKVKTLIHSRSKEIQFLNKLERNLFLHRFQRYLITKNNDFQNLDQIADVVSGITKGRKTKEVELKEVPYLRVANVQDGYFDLSEIKTIEASVAEIERYRIEKGDLLLTEGGDSDKLGRGNVWMEDETDFIFQNHIFRVRIKDLENYRPSFLNALTGSDFGRAYFRKQAKQTTGIASINSRQIKGFPVPVVPMEEQVIFEQETDAINAMHTKLKQTLLPELETLFQSLLQRAFHGDLTIDPDLQLDGHLENENFSAIAADAVLIQTLIDRFNDAKTNTLSEEVEILAEDEEEEEIKSLSVESEAAYNRAKDALYHLLKEGLVTQKTPENEEETFKTYLATS